MKTPSLVPGSMLASRWIVGGVLGRSDTASVYEAEEAHQRRFAALKLFEPAFAHEPAWGEHVALTRAVSELAGDGLARAYDCGVDPALGRPYVASERITFPTLARYVTERGPLPLWVVAHALTTLGPALDAAHAAGIVHGGLKPQNVFVSFDNPHWARITDFGVARLRAAVGRGPAALLGFGAPELARGVATAAADRYALGLVCFFAATGVAWWSALKSGTDGAAERPRLASLRAQSQGGELDPAFDAWFERALAVEPEARFASASAMASAFLEVFTAAPTTELPARSSVHPLSATARMRASEVPELVERWRARDAAPAEALPATSSSVPPVASNVAAAGTERASSPPLDASDSRRTSDRPRHSRVPPTVVLAATLADASPRTEAASAEVAPRAAASHTTRWVWLAVLACALAAILGLVWLSRS